SLTNSEKLKIKEKLAWSEEMALNFKSAYALYSELLEGRQPRDKNALKLALLADLAGRNSTRHYQDFIKYTRSRKEANLVRAQLIEKSRSPWNDLLKEIRPLSSTPDLLASLTLSIYSKYKNDRQLKRVLQASRIENYQEGKSLVRKSDIPQIERAARNLRNHRITARSQYLLNKSIGRRMTLIQSMEKLADQAIRSRDWLLQATTIEILKNEYARLTNDLIALPVPKNLNAAQRKQYDRSFTAQLAPLKSKTSAFAKKADEFWSNKSAIKKMTSLYEESSIPVRRFLARELRFASNIAPSSVGRSIRSSLESSIDQPSRSAVNQAWQNLKDDPFSVSKIEKLRKLESQRGSDSVVAYLDSRKKVLEGTN
ncbi:MAG: hypothetical protein KDD25_10115, partial [Bdellovibrionales bacterium]|nr:hypothetical protein [Bdellovibrionales bacterium]